MLRIFITINAIIFFSLFLDSTSYCQNWTLKANFGGGNTYQATGFSIGSKGYIGLGNDGSFKNDFWEYDPTTNAWTQKANFGGSARQNATGFSIGLKGYIGCGQDAIGLLNDFWEYDQATNVWSQKNSFPGAARRGATGFSIGNYGYMGTGMIGAPTIATNDFWQYDPGNNSWIQKANVGGSIRYYAVGFSLNGYGYIGTGTNPNSSGPGQSLQDFWRYDTTFNTWMPKADLPNSSQRTEAVGFSIPLKNKGYIGTGYKGSTPYMSDFWEYNPLVNLWSQIASYAGTGRDFAVGFSIDSCAYVGTGWDGFKRKDFWEYGDCAICISPIISMSSDVTICAGSSETISAVATSGAPPYTYTWIPATGLACATCSSTEASPASTTTYSVIVTDDGNCPDTNKITVTVIPPLAASITGNSALCTGDSTVLTVNGGTQFIWDNGQTTSSITVLPVSSTSYSVITSISSCIDTISFPVTVYPYPIVSVSGNSPICEGENTTLYALSLPFAGGYLWSTGAASSSIVVNPSATTSYSVISSIGPCTDSAEINVVVLPNPTVNAGPDVTIMYGSSTTLTASGNSGFIWNTGSTSDSIIVNPTVTTTYTLITTNSNGCTSIDVVTVFVDPLICPVFLPNAFSPNQDGENDTLHLYSDDWCIKDTYIIIYNRWGELVFQSNEKNFKWDGSNHSNTLNTAVFVYHLTVNFIDGSQTIKKGNISLIR